LSPLTASGNVSYYLGDTSQANYKANPANSSNTQGFELAIPWDSIGGPPTDSVKIFVIYQSDNGFMSNQFLSKAIIGEGNYGNNPVAFAAAAPNAIAVGVVKYLWSNAATTQSISTATGGTYTVTITDAKNCSQTRSYALYGFTNTIAMATANNALSWPNATTCVQEYVNDGANQNFYTTSCAAICNIQNNTNTIAPGNTDACVSILVPPVYAGIQPYVKRVFNLQTTNLDFETVTLYFTDDDFISYNLYRGLFDSIATHAGGNATAIVTVTQVGLIGNIVHGPLTAIWNNSALRWELMLSNITIDGTFYTHAGNPNNAPLAIGDIDLKAKFYNEALELYWKTAGNIMYKNFEIWASNNGVDFVMNTKMATNINNTFEFSNATAINNYYKILGHSIDGKKVWSNTVRIENYNNNGLNIYPNPVNNNLQLSFEILKSTDVTVYVTDILGKVVLQENNILQSGTNHLQFNIGLLKNGIYFIKIISGNGLVLNKQFVKG
jgi:Secretion system C-terminal sorting domain